MLNITNKALVVVYFSACVLFWSAVAPAAAQNKATYPEQIRVVADKNHLPFLFVDSNGNPQGYEADMWRLFSEHTGIKVQLDAVSWEQAQQAVLSGDADVIDMIYSSAYRKDQFEFTPAYIKMPIDIYVANHLVDKIQTPEDLRNYGVGVEKGSPCIEYLHRWGVKNIHVAPFYDQLVQDAVDQTINVFCMARYPAQYYLYNKDASANFQAIFPVTKKTLYRAVKKGNNAMRQVVERGMSQITMQQREWAAQRWLREPSALNIYVRVALIVLAVIVIAALLLALWIWGLRRSVRRRTLELEREQVKSRAFFDSSPDPVWINNPQGILLECNKRAWDFFHIKPKKGDSKGQRLQLFNKDFSDRARAVERLVVTTGQTHTRTLNYKDQGGVRYIELKKAPILNADGKLNGIFTIARDITARLKAEHEQRLAAVAFQGQSAMLVLDANQNIQRVNHALEKLCGVRAENIIGQVSTQLERPQESSVFTERVWQYIENIGHWQTEHWVQGPNQQPRLVKTLISAVYNNARTLSHYVVSMLDLTQEHEASAHADRLRYFDALTNLPNKNFLTTHLTHAIEQAHSTWALYFIDLDDFKRINEVYGHDVGDELLIMVAQRLRDHVAWANDLFRYAGGTFVVFKNFEPDDDSHALAYYGQRLQQVIKKPFKLGKEQALVSMTMSVGWAEYKQTQTTPGQVIKEAELAMYQAKQRGSGQLCGFKPQYLKSVVDREQVIQQLRQALQHNQLLLYLQPQFHATGEIIGAEALLRWQREVDGEKQWVSPAYFVPLAEESGLILELGAWVLKRACQLLAQWQNNKAMSNLVLSVNVSAKQFIREDFVDQVLNELHQTGANPRQLKLELTETALLGDVSKVAAKLSRLQKHGLRICLDDFGTGYASLTYLSRLPLDELKIDQSFVAHVTTNKTDAVLAQATIWMAQGLGLEIVAEGVETEQQKQFLEQNNCELFQGFLLAMPQASAEFRQRFADEV